MPIPTREQLLYDSMYECIKNYDYSLDGVHANEKLFVEYGHLDGTVYQLKTVYCIPNYMKVSRGTVRKCEVPDNDEPIYIFE